jgi:hypothetical protein
MTPEESGCTSPWPCAPEADVAERHGKASDVSRGFIVPIAQAAVAEPQPLVINARAP